MFKKNSKPVKVWKTVVGDILIFAVSILVFAYFHHVKPQKGSEGLIVTLPTANTAATADGTTDTDGLNSTDDTGVPSTGKENPTLTPVPGMTESVDTADITVAPEETDYSYLGLGEKFHEKFNTDNSVTKTDSSYVSGRTAVYYSTFSYKGSTYHVADIYVCDITSFRTVLANDKDCSYESIESMAERSNAVLATNGDYYGLHPKTTFVVRNGVLYWPQVSSVGDLAGKKFDNDVCVLYSDGKMVSYTSDEFDPEYAVMHGAWQAWTFGPILVKNGEAVNDFGSISIRRAGNPRTAVGYFEPGHYCLVCADGRSSVSAGPSLIDFAAAMASLGCSGAYNLDGGDSSVMYYNGKVVSNRSGSGTRSLSDAIVILDSNK